MLASRCVYYYWPELPQVSFLSRQNYEHMSRQNYEHLSRQAYFCRDKHKHVFCRHKTSVAEGKFCRDKRPVFSRQTRVCRDKRVLVWTKMILVAAPANDTIPVSRLCRRTHGACRPEGEEERTVF